MFQRTISQKLHSIKRSTLNTRLVRMEKDVKVYFSAVFFRKCGR